MLCPECGTEVADTAKSCSNCGRSLKTSKRSGSSTRVITILVIVLVALLLGGAGYAIFIHDAPDKNVGHAYNPEGREWVPMKFDPYGISMDVPGVGWSLYYDAQSQFVLKDELRATLDIHIISAITLNPDQYRIDNKPHVFRVLSQESVTLPGFGEASYTVAEGIEAGYMLRKHQIYFRRSLTDRNKQIQTYTYLITLSYQSGLHAQYASFFPHILDSIRLYEYAE